MVGVPPGDTVFIAVLPAQEYESMEWFTDLIWGMEYAVLLSLEPQSASAMVPMIPASLLRQPTHMPAVGWHI